MEVQTEANRITCLEQHRLENNIDSSNLKIYFLLLFRYDLNFREIYIYLHMLIFPEGGVLTLTYRQKKKDKTAVVICRGNFPIQLRESYMFVDTMGSVYVKNIYSTYFSEIGYLLNLYIYWSYGRFCCMYVLHVLSRSILSGIRNHISANKVLAIFHFL